MAIMAILAIFFCGTFFGAAVYISIAQHPAAMKAGVAVAARFFPPMYNLAAPMQIASAVVGTAAGLITWLLGGGVAWLIGALLLVSVIPYTLVALKPINDQLLDAAAERTDAETEVLLKRWAPRHAVRSIASGLSFATYLWAGVGNP